MPTFEGGTGPGGGERYRGEGAPWPAGLDALLRRVEKPARYIGGEWNEVRKDPRGVSLRVGLVFPDVYEIGMSYLGQKILYAMLNARPDIAAERVFAPWPDMELELRRRNMPLFTLENKIPLHELDVLGFSLLYELNDSNILTVLDLGRIPVLAGDRRPEDPLVLAGGPAAFNPEPLAGLFDAFVLGDGEEAVLEVVDLYGRLKKERPSRPELWRELAALPGLYVPGLYREFRAGPSSLVVPRPGPGAPERVSKRVVKSFGRSFFPRDIIVPDVQAVFDRVAVEAARGCPQRCRFCQAASIYFPYRVKNPSALIDTTLDSLRRTGFQDAALTALSIGDYPYLSETVRLLMKELEIEEVSLSLSSLRPRGLTGELAAHILKVRKTGFTLVPEAGSERLRRVINKDMTDDDVFRAAEVAFAGGWRLLKLYFMIGLPGERSEDLEAIARMVRTVLELGERKLGRPPLVNLSVSSFIPKPHTPFQWLAMEKADVLEDKQDFLRRELKRHGSVKVKFHRLEHSLLEAVFSRGDRRLLAVLREAWKRGARFDAWKDRWSPEAWREAFRSADVDPADYLGALDPRADLPWDRIDTGMKKEHLLEESLRAERELPTPSCLETACGACQGCRPDVRPEKTFGESPALSSFRGEPAGEPAPEPVRYRAEYEKSGRARYLGHNDLINVLQRAFRRAGVSVLRSGGFHPKMRMSFLPALPLGMTGLAEALEFWSGRLFEESDFIRRMNGSLPPGVRFLSLRRLGASDVGLGRDVRGFIYSLDLDGPEVRAALEALPGRLSPDARPAAAGVQATAEVLSRLLPAESITVFVPSGGDRISFRVITTGPKPPRLQAVLADALPLEDAVHFLTRESVLYHSEGP